MKTQQRKEYILELRSRGMAWGKIGKLLGISRQRTHQIRTGYMSPASRPKPVSELKIYNLRKLESLGLPTITLGHIEGSRDKIRERVRIRDNHICQICFKKWEIGKRRFDVHHLDINMEGKSFVKGITKMDKENFKKLITLCHKCHLNLHTVREKMKKNH